MMHFPFAELKARHTSNLPKYNHTLATILVEYASAVSSIGIIYVQPLSSIRRGIIIIMHVKFV